MCRFGTILESILYFHHGVERELVGCGFIQPPIPSPPPWKAEKCREPLGSSNLINEGSREA